MAGPLFGQLLALFSAFCFALTTACVSRTTIRTGDRGVTFSTLVTILFSLLLWLWLEGGDLSALQAEGAWRPVLWFAIAGLCAMVFGRSFLYLSVRTLGVTRSSATKRLNPFFSVALAALVLAEPISGITGLGLVVIAVAFAILIHAALRHAPDDDRRFTLLDFAPGIIAALAYAGAYVTRKLGLAEMPSPALGILISAVAGLAVFVAMTPFSPRQRTNFTAMFRNMDRWTLAAAILMSLGQIALFTALLYEDVTVIVMIASLEVFIASFLSVAIFRTESRPDLMTYVSAVLATFGVVLIAVG